MDILERKRGKPLQDRDETITVLNALMGIQKEEGDESSLERARISNVHGEGPLLVSDIPLACQGGKPGVVVGIDEAGRGSVLGPMIYGAAFWNSSDAAKIPKGFNDSKQLTEEKREQLLKKILKSPEIGFCVRVLNASEISRNMLRRQPYNLNQMSHDAAASMLQEIQNAGVHISEAFIDTVGNADHYKSRLERQFPNINFTVESKADAKYGSCSAASVVAKNVRDYMMKNFMFSEKSIEADKEFGSGYPSDPVCKKWMEQNQNCSLFGFPDVVRFSWNPIKKALQDKSLQVTFEADEDDDEQEDFEGGKKRQQQKMTGFLGPNGHKKQKRYPFFERRKMETVSQFI